MGAGKTQGRDGRLALYGGRTCDSRGLPRTCVFSLHSHYAFQGIGFELTTRLPR
jgi:hypothetical protein